MFHSIFIFSCLIFVFWVFFYHTLWHVDQPWINPGSLQMEAQSINRWTIRDIFSEIFNKRIETLRNSQDKRELVLSLIFKAAAIKFIKSI